MDFLFKGQGRKSLFLPLVDSELGLNWREYFTALFLTTLLFYPINVGNLYVLPVLTPPETLIFLGYLGASSGITGFKHCNCSKMSSYCASDPAHISVPHCVEIVNG